MKAKTKKTQKGNIEAIPKKTRKGSGMVNDEILRKSILAYLADEGMTQYKFQDTRGLTVSCLTNLLKGRTKFIRSSTIDKIMPGVQPYYEKFKHEAKLKVEDAGVRSDETEKFYDTFGLLEKDGAKLFIVREMFDSLSTDNHKKHICSLYSSLDDDKKQELNLIIAKTLQVQTEEKVKNISKDMNTEKLQEIERKMKN